MKKYDYEKVVAELHIQAVRLQEILSEDGYFSQSFKNQQKKVADIKNYLDTAQPAVGL